MRDFSLKTLEIINVVYFAKSTFITYVDAHMIQMFYYEQLDDAAAVDPHGIKKLLANGLSTFPIKSSSLFTSGPKSLPKNTPDCPVLCN